MKYVKVTSVLLIVLQISCKSKYNIYKEYYDTQMKKIRVSGLVDVNSGLPMGEWSYYDTLGRIISKGSQNKGYYVGEWDYLIDGAKKVKINWSICNNDRYRASFNCPSGVIKVNDDRFVYLATNNDTTNKVDLIINKIPIRENETLELYKSNFIEDIKKVHNVVDYTCKYQLVTSKKEYYLMIFNLIKNNKPCTMFHILSLNQEHEIIEVNCFTSKNKEQESYNMFTGMFLHLAFEHDYFYNPMENIVKEVYCE